MIIREIRINKKYYEVEIFIWNRTFDKGIVCYPFISGDVKRAKRSKNENGYLIEWVAV